jgi:hypothetical protein
VIEITGLSVEQVAEPRSTEESTMTAEEGEPTAADSEDQPRSLPEEVVVSREDLDSNWMTVGKAARILGVSESTVRRRLAVGTLRGELVHDPLIGAKRWMIHVDELPTPESEAGTLIPIEAIDRLESAWDALREATARAERAERIAEFEKDRRAEAETDRRRLRSLLAAENQLAEQVSKLEREKRITVEKERDRLRAMLDAKEPVSKSRWKAFNDRWLRR